MKKLSFIISFLLFGLIFLPNFVFASSTSGFIPGQIWYSSENFVEGETVNIYTAVWNSGTNPLSVKIEFYDKNVILGTREVTLSPAELKSVYVPWRITLGDHTISAKIVSSSENISGTKEKITLENTKTSNDRQFVSVTVKNSEGESTSPASDAIKNQIEKTSNEIKSVVPESVNSSVSSVTSDIDNFRSESYVKVSSAKSDVKDEISYLKEQKNSPTIEEKTQTKSNIEDSIKEPVAYIKLFLFSVVAFILGNKFVFYAVLILLIFFILKFIYLRLRNRR